MESSASNPKGQKPAYEVLQAYGPTPVTVEALVYASLFSKMHNTAINLLVEYAETTKGYNLVRSHVSQRMKDPHVTRRGSFGTLMSRIKQR